MSDKPRIIHVSADFPDALDASKTPVIARLVDLVADRYDQSVISLNRRSPPLQQWIRPQPRVEVRAETDSVTTLSYAAPPAGLHHWRMLRHLGETLADRLVSQAPDLIIGHKLTVEGIAVARAAQLLGIPYAISIQGNTDTRIMSVRRDLASRLAEIYHGAAFVFPFTPWAHDAVEARLGPRSGPHALLPCALAGDEWKEPKSGGDTLVSAFHLRNARLKNLPRMAGAVVQARESEPDLQLGIVGGGDANETCLAEAMLAQGSSLEGPLPNAAIRARFARARGFVMPSRRESFGLVFIEALQSGLPIAYPAGAAIDGYFDGCDFALRVDARNTRAIADAMLTLHRDEARLKASLATWQVGEQAKRFTRPAIADAFANGIDRALNRNAGSRTA
ncbi:glycosyltransferase family 4 protein [Qipengyuania sp. CAU 1752]